jgi:oligosaccharide repeat unit polymerase
VVRSRTKGSSRMVTRGMDAFLCLLLVITTFVLCLEFVGFKEAIGSSFVIALSLWLTTGITPLFNFSRVTILSFWYLTYLAMVFFSAFIVFDDQADPYRARFLFAVHTALITVPIGCLLANACYRFRRSETEQFFRTKTVQVSNPKRLRTIYLLLLIPSIFLALIYIHSVDNIPLFYLWSNPGEYLQAALLREDSFKLLDSPLLYAFYVLRSDIFPFLVIVSLGVYLRTKRKLWRTLFIGTTAAAIFYCSLSAAKLPVAAIIALIGFLIYFTGGGTISRRTIAILLIGMLVFPVGVILIAYQGQGLDNLGDALYFIFARLTYTPSEVVYYYFEVFPDHHEFLAGRSVDKFARLMGKAPFNTPMYVGAYAARPGDSDTVSFNSAFIADLYADFGMPGVFFGGVLAGFVMQWFHIYTVRRKKTITTVALYSFLVFTFWFLNSTSLPIVLASNGAILVTALSWWFDRSPTHPSRRIGPESLEPAPS